MFHRPLEGEPCYPGINWTKTPTWWRIYICIGRIRIGVRYRYKWFMPFWWIGKRFVFTIGRYDTKKKRKRSHSVYQSTEIPRLKIPPTSRRPILTPKDFSDLYTQQARKK